MSRSTSVTESSRGIQYKVSDMNRGLDAAGWKKTKGNRTRFANGYVVDADRNQTYDRAEIRSASQALVQGRGAAKQPHPVKIARPRGSIKNAVAATPATIASRYAVGLRQGTKQLVINPRRQIFARGMRAASSRRVVSTTDTAQGGKAVGLTAGDEFKRGAWVHKTLRSVVKSPALLQKLTNAGYNLDMARDLLVVNTKTDNQPMVFAFKDATESNNPRGVAPARFPGFRSRPRGFAIICQDVSTHTMGAGGGGPIYARKPVIYLYPEKTTKISVEVSIDGEFVAQYPKPRDGAWEMMATPDGMLMDTKTERKYSYLFWEGTMNDWEIDPSQAFCVEGQGAEQFLETVSERFALNDREKTYFISYWLPSLEKNELSLVQFLSEEAYESYAQMKVTREPETTIRLFMIFRQAHGLEKVGNPDLAQLQRKGYTVVEWGGANLDER